MDMTDEERQVAEAAIQFAKANRTAIARRLTDPSIYVSEEEPVAVFMAGSPGAGKTETSRSLLQKFQTNGNKILRIDPDELREEFPGYGGGNAWLFQSAVSRLVDRILDMAFKQKQSFLLDGTLSSHNVAEKNVSRSIRKGRVVQILYVYQTPLHAWEFCAAREELEGRRIKRETFIDQYFAARNVVNSLKEKFAKKIQVDLLLKNPDGSTRVYKANIDRIDNFVPEKYDRASLEALLRSGVQGQPER